MLVITVRCINKFETSESEAFLQMCDRINKHYSWCASFLLNISVILYTETLALYCSQSVKTGALGNTDAENPPADGSIGSFHFGDSATFTVLNIKNKERCGIGIRLYRTLGVHLKIYFFG